MCGSVVGTACRRQQPGTFKLSTEELSYREEVHWQAPTLGFTGLPWPDGMKPFCTVRIQNALRNQEWLSVVMCLRFPTVKESSRTRVLYPCAWENFMSATLVNAIVEEFDDRFCQVTIRSACFFWACIQQRRTTNSVRVIVVLPQQFTVSYDRHCCKSRSQWAHLSLSNVLYLHVNHRL